MSVYKYICNALSLQMVEEDANIRKKEITKEEFDAYKDITPSAVGHADTAAVLGVECNRCNVKLNIGDFIMVAQLQGGRLPEGAKTLPLGFSFKYYHVEILPYED